MQNTHYSLEEKIADQATHFENTGPQSISHEAFNRRNSLPDGSRRNSMSKNFDHAASAMVINDKTHVEVSDEVLPDNDIDNIAVSWYVWLVAATASIAGALFGYDTGIISAVLVYLGTDLDNKEASSGEKEAITALCSAGAFVGAIIAGLTADKYGRKIAIYVGCVLFTIGAVLQGASYSIAQMCVGRLIVGFGVGSAAMVVPLYIAEIAPTKVRGRLIGLNNMSITGGQVISYGIGAAFAHVGGGWRYMVGLGALPAIVLAALLPFCPESPRQLIFHGRLQEAEAVLLKIYKGASIEQVRAKVALIAAACEEAKELNEGSRWMKIKQLHTNPANLRALVCACGLMVISQMSGFNTLMYYSSTLFALVGFSNPVAVGLVVAGTNFVMTWVNMMTVDPIGRRRVLVSTVWGMSAGLLAVAIAFSFIPVNTENLELEATSVSAPAIVVLVFIIWFVFFYGVSVGNTAWMSTDFFPMEVRAMGTMWLTCSCWGSNIIVSSTFLSMMKGMTPSGAFGFYAAICGLGWVLIILFYPEVSGLTLEEIGDVFKSKNPVKFARNLRRERKEEIKERMRTMEKPLAVGH
ncbi:general substrate transporter [Hortaea werneckii]|nr:general substrate transporter [Hortaea werneckii]KAI6993126.1 general substrate transporter [Hortaea werneckii]KAI7145348.1 general substrate transporter [Hortaea werneckii]KAI7172312.1 general substrate transporter [Hortaea werneckii]